MGKKSDEIARQRELAWVGDAVLALWARQWILANPEKRGEGTVAEAFTRMTSNQFLGCIGDPTAVEAKIGRIYQNEGESAAVAWMEDALLPLFLKQQANRKQNPPKKKRRRS